MGWIYSWLYFRVGSRKTSKGIRLHMNVMAEIDTYPNKQLLTSFVGDSVSITTTTGFLVGIFDGLLVVGRGVGDADGK